MKRGFLVVAISTTIVWIILSSYTTSDVPNFSQLLNITDFNFMIQQPACPANLDLLVLVHSAPRNFAKRQAIRQKWANQTENSKFGNFLVYFLLGMVNTTAKQGEIVLENDQFNDIIQGSFVDHYHNMTYKHVMVLEWFELFCNTAKILLKVDDDVLVNTPFILHSTRNSKFWELIQDENKDYIFCKEWPHSLIFRDKSSKWYVSEDEVPGKYYPSFCSGSAIFYAPHTVSRLLEEVRNVKFLFMDDVFITGLVRKRINVNITHYGFVWNNNTNEIKAAADNVNLTNFFIGPSNCDLVSDKDRLWKSVQNLNKYSNIV